MAGNFGTLFDSTSKNYYKNLGGGGVSARSGGYNVSASSGTSQSNSYSGLDEAAKAAGDKAFDSAYAQTGSLGNSLSLLTGSRRDAYLQAMDAATQGMSGMGEAERGRIYRDFNASRNSVGNSLANSGLYNTTVKQNMEQGVDRNQAEALGMLDESLRQQMLDLMIQRAEGVDRIAGDEISNQRDVGLGGINVLTDKASFNPTYSRSTSTSSNSSLSQGENSSVNYGSGGGGGGGAYVRPSVQNLQQANNSFSNSLLNQFGIQR